ncbi:MULTISPECIES: DUF3772 domain-containing protein [Halocynthiibacter]|uniref:DUF3772 domain-containing protein n=1 Tax=Halocynthiibacter halioticoli TaxID=2986804 RepID=A0AAE3J3A8_9RHOB|nr:MULTISPECIES: DUF3772 domain-containing protein [Halocynthiibacter]MCV6824567.1 DUF3772 domain-containing protein [Halocynthiibacter halioticoli]MCW4057568.1 DUF3772 domain-containing protein [Halocynthiibacter sp. SDUM655004]
MQRAGSERHIQSLNWLRWGAALLCAAFILLWAGAGFTQDAEAPAEGNEAEAASEVTGESESIPLEGEAKQVRSLLAMADLDLLDAEDIVGTGVYRDWQITARQAEEIIGNPEATDQEIEELRSEVAQWREVFLTGRPGNEERLRTLEAQLAAIAKPTPETPEVDVVTEKRKALEEEIARVRLPHQAVDEALAQATGLIREIDALMRERQVDALSEIAPSPLLPTYWGSALELLYNFAFEREDVVSSDLVERRRYDHFKENFHLIILYGVLGLALLFRGSKLVRSYMPKSDADVASSRHWLIVFVLSFLASMAPLAGLLLVFEAISETGYVRLRAAALVEGLQYLAISFYVAHWLAHMLFPSADDRIGVADLVSDRRFEARLYFELLGLIYGLFLFARVIFRFEIPEIGTRAVILFPLIVATGLLAYRFAHVVVKAISLNRLEDQEQQTAFRDKILKFICRIVMAISIVGPVLAAAGYYTASVALVFPMIPSIGLIAVLTLLFRVVNEVYDAVSKQSGAHNDALLPVMFAFLVCLASLPVFALIWGVRAAQLSELWTTIREGVTIGGLQISPEIFFYFALIFAIGFMITRLVQGALRTTILPKTRLDIGGQNALVAGVGYVGIFLAGLVAVMSAGIDLTSLAFVAGALSLGIGFGLQNIVSNFVSGIILLVERPISEGDWIDVGGQMGYVRDISVRSTRIETFDRTDVIIPNGDLVSGVVTNWTRGNSVGRLVLPVGAAYGSDAERVQEILLEVAKGHPMVLAAPEPSALLVRFGADSIDFEIRAILRDVNWKLAVASEMNHEILKRFAAEGIEIPFAQRDIWLRNPEALRPTSRPTAQPSPKTPSEDSA